MALTARRPGAAEKKLNLSWYPEVTAPFSWAPYLFVRLLLYLVTGIGWVLAGLPFDPAFAWWCIADLLFLYLVLWGVCRFSGAGKAGKIMALPFGLLAMGIISVSGALLAHNHTATSAPDHLIHQHAPAGHFSGVISSEVQDRPGSYKAELEVSLIRTGNGWRRATGKVMVYLAKPAERPRYGDILLIKGAPRRVPAPANPGEFDYRSYLAIGQVYHQCFVREGQFRFLKQDVQNPVFAASLRVRQWADGVLRKFVPGKQEYAIATGLVLGIRDVLDEDLKNAYASAGAMHVLAVSGAHVVIVFLVINFLLGKLKKVRYGNFLFAVVSLGLLWFYAFVTGLSSSVLRAVVMFSFIVVAETLRRDKSTYNFIAASAFFLLLWNPHLLPDVGFQLSYVAVLGIVYLQPKLYSQFDFQNWLADKVWGMSTTCLAAQIAVAPFSLFYFHQFPVYFLLANPAVILLSTAILYGGMILLAVSPVPYLSAFSGWVLSFLIKCLNQTAFLTEKLPYAIVGGFAITRFEFVAMCLLLVFFLLFLKYKKLWQLSVSGMLVALLVVLNTVSESRQQTQRRIAVYAVNGFSTCDIIEGSHHLLVADSALLANSGKIKFHLVNDWYQHGITNHTYALFSGVAPQGQAWQTGKDYSLLCWEGKRFIFLHGQVSTETLRTFKADYLVVQHNALRSLKGVTRNVGQIIIDSSNKYHRSRKLRDEAAAAGVRCHWIAEDGAWQWQVE